MEDNAELFIDPEEDEVFFYGVTERECQVKSVLENKMLCDTKKISESRSNQNDHGSKDIRGKIQPENGINTVNASFEPATHAGFEQITDLSWLSNSSNLQSVPFDSAKNQNITDTCPVTGTYQESLKSQATEDNVESPKKQNTPGKQKVDSVNGFPSALNIHIDHSYSIPVKNVIDKNILKTPKSIVKADKDGGFLKVLSEIALVKAEVDENSLGDMKNISDVSPAKELKGEDDDDKENKQSEIEKFNVTIKQGDLSPAKVNHNLNVNKGNNESEKRISCPLEKGNGGHLDSIAMLDLGNTEIAETINEQISGNEKVELESFETETVDDPIDELCMVKSLSLKDNPLSDSNIAIEEPNDNLMGNGLVIETKTTEKFPSTDDLIELDNTKDISDEDGGEEKRSEDLEGICNSENDFLKKGYGISPVPELKLPVADEDVGTEKKDDSGFFMKDTNSSGRDSHKKFVRRNTMRLLEELNELVTFGQSKRESMGTDWSTKLSEEAAKVIQKLKAVGFDDSICSPEQYFDLDKLDNSIFNVEISDMLNDTLSKPLSHITGKDVESLLEKITASSMDAESDDEFNLRKADSSNVGTKKNFMDLSEKTTADHQKSSDFKTEKFQKIAKDENKFKTGIPARLESTEHVSEAKSGSSETTKSTHKSVSPSRTVESKLKVPEFRSVEKKNRGLTRIPKLVSTTSKVPITAKEVKQHFGYMGPNRTPFLKAQKSLKFNNIDNAVGTNVHSKMPVVTSSIGKPKSATKNDVINAKAKSVVNKPRNLFPKTETKINSQFNRLKTGISLKGSATESQLPKSVAKVPKVPVGDSPMVTTKYGFSIQRPTPKRP